MKWLFWISLFCVLAVASRAAPSPAIAFKQDPNNSDKCVEVNGIALSKGERAPASPCGEMICLDDGRLIIQWCGFLSPNITSCCTTVTTTTTTTITTTTE